MIKNISKLIFITSLMLLTAFISEVSSEGFRSSNRSSSFQIPSALRPRVNFWIDIFTKYGKNQVVLHHRNYPQAVYSTLDFKLEAQVLSAGKLEAYRKKAIAVETKDIESAIRLVAAGKTPKTRLQQRVKEALSKVPGGSSKYKTALEKDMVRSQTGIKEKYAEAVKRSGRYMHLLEKIFVVENGLPVELTRLPFIESSFDYTAYSSVGAAGIWQFMPRTAKGFGMKVGSVIDERRDVLKATAAAAKYLKSAYSSLGNWPMALTSYNHGVAGVKRKIRQFGTSNIVELIENPKNQAFGFASANFWPEFLAALDVYDNYQRYFPGLKLDSARHYSTYRINSSMSASYVSKKLGLDESTLQEYNYALSPSVWKGRYRIPSGYLLRIPAGGQVNTMALKAPEPSSQVTSSIYGGLRYKVRRGDTLSGIARKHGSSVSRIKALNGLKSDRVYIGQTLTIKEQEAHSVQLTKASSTVRSSASTSYRVKSGDSLYKIARKHGMSVSEIQRLNGLKSSKIVPGQVIKLRSGSKAKTSSGSSSTYYKVRRGDTLWDISRKFGISITSIKQKNNLRGNSLYVGQKLRVR